MKMVKHESTIVGFTPHNSSIPVYKHVYTFDNGQVVEQSTKSLKWATLKAEKADAKLKISSGVLHTVQRPKHDRKRADRKVYRGHAEIRVD